MKASSSSHLSSSLTFSVTTSLALLTLLLLSSPTIINAQDIIDDANSVTQFNTTLSQLPDSSEVITIDETIPLSNEEMASYGLNLSEFNEVRSTESPIDFGQLGLAYDEETNVMYEGLWDTDMLWMDAAIFEYEVSF